MKITEFMGDWTCTCYNTASEEGFYPSNEVGNEVVPDNNWKNLYTCNKCGNIIDQMTLEIVGNSII